MTFINDFILACMSIIGWELGKKIVSYFEEKKNK